MFLSSNFPLSWHKLMKKELLDSYFLNLENFLSKQKKSNKDFYPPQSLIFKALLEVPPNKVKVIILGQDPYHGPGQAEGLSFSVPNGIKRPPSLRNIFKELSSDTGAPFKSLENNSLLSWTNQGVFLLNSVLTVSHGSPASHSGIGWEQFTDAVINKLNDEYANLVFILWGAYAQKKANFIDTKKHLVLYSSHPSPFSAHRGFLGSKVFSKTNSYLIKKNKTPINWLSVKAE
ncbi:MAG: uracil-DNA glycosylase [Bdellovibrionales bacterium]|nr:uracil-DNA glycosylase [Bdellovibrionales bacterium]